MPRLIIIDHSLCNLQGHHYECSVAIAEAAARVGYKPIIVANKTFSSSLYPKDIETLSLFERDWFDQPTIFPSLSIWQKLLQAPEKLNQKFLSFKNRKFLLLRTNIPQSALFLEKIQGSTERLIDGIQKDLNLLKFIPFSNTIWGLLKIGWGLIRFSLNIIIKIINRSLRNLIKTQQTQEFSETLIAVLKKLNLSSEDHLLVHTLSIEQLEKIYILLNSSDYSTLPKYHILLRRNIDDPLVINAQGMGLQSCLNHFYNSKLWPEKINFYTDTEDLVRKHNTLSSVRFTQISIPFRHEKLQDSLLIKNDLCERLQPIHLVYLGDARSEKGYQHLPDLIHALWDNYFENEKVKFTIQSNFNTNGGELGILEAKLKLEQYPARKVKLIQEAIFPDEYYQLLSSADLVILPYNPENYQRTSGVLTEALAAGKPVVVPANSWLAQQVDESRARIYQSPDNLAQFVIDAIENIEKLTEAANDYKLEWREKQSPDNFVRTLLEKPNFSEINELNLIHKNDVESNINLPVKHLNSTILVILNIENFLAQDKLNLETFDRVKYLFQCGYQVYGIFYLNPKNQDQQTITLLTDQVENCIEKFSFEDKWFINKIVQNPIPENINPKQDINNVCHNKNSLVGELIEINNLQINGLTQFFQTIKIDAILTNSVLSIQLIQKLNLAKIPKICEVSRLKSFHYALSNQRDLDPVELSLETDLLNQYQAIITPEKIMVEKLNELLNQPIVYDCISRQNHALLNQVFTTILGDRALPLQDFIRSKKIAILYPWPDILERKTGASQRVGLLIDYLQEECCEMSCFSIGEKKQFWRSGIFYNYFEPHFSQANLVEEVYKNAYSSWRSSLNLLSKDAKEKVDLESNFDAENYQHDWLPWIYYQFRFDPAFHQWIEEITDWADVVILEYPFWAEIVGKICHQKNVKLILTAHDVLAQNLDENSLLRKIALAEEINALKQADSVVTLSENDQTFFQKYNIQSNCVPIGIDTQKINSFCQQKVVLQSSQDLEITNQINANFCLFVGSEHLPNIKAVKQIHQWLELDTQTTKFCISKFVIVGNCWKKEEDRNFLSLGKVSNELLGYLYQNASLVVSPLLAGTGMSVKIIEAMAYGKVIVGTSISFRGYPVESGIHCIICDTLESYPNIIEDLLQEPKKLKFIGDNAQKFAQNYDYRYLYKTYLDLIL